MSPEKSSFVQVGRLAPFTLLLEKLPEDSDGS
jgi:hypothetical protein